jgi:hypothetical protein
MDQLRRADKIACKATLLRATSSRYAAVVSPTWIWMQAAIVLFVVIGMIIAITKLT